MQQQFLQTGSGKNRRRIAVLAAPGIVSRHRPGIVWLGGWRSHMSGTKAEALAKWCAASGLACCRHDYSGHGSSGGKFADGTISRWLEESLGVFERFCKGPQILVGSSMGGWIALRMAQELPKRRLHAMLLIAPAADFTGELLWPSLSARQQAAIAANGCIEVPSHHSPGPDVYTSALFSDGKRNQVLTGLIETNCPVHILQGRRDSEVPFTHAIKLASHLAGEKVSMTMVPDGDHRLSRPQDIALMLGLLENLVEAA